jgi:hypothetical protein
LKQLLEWLYLNNFFKSSVAYPHEPYPLIRFSGESDLVRCSL